MMAKVVHCMKDKYDVYIGRGKCPKSGRPGKFGNPFKIGVDGSRERVIILYRAWLLSQPLLAAKVKKELCNKILGCWCAPLSCHGDVLLEIANGNEADGSSDQSDTLVS